MAKVLASPGTGTSIEMRHLSIDRYEPLHHGLPLHESTPLLLTLAARIGYFPLPGYLPVNLVIVAYISCKITCVGFHLYLYDMGNHPVTGDVWDQPII